MAKSHSRNNFQRQSDSRGEVCGKENDARIRVNEKLLNWAELIFVMEKRHKQRLLEKFEHVLDGKEIVILDIEDHYQYMDEELIEMLRVSVKPYFETP